MNEPEVEGRRERKKRETREKILARARELFTERGYAGTTMADIADSLDVSTQTVFNYFATKDRLLLGLAEELTTRFETLLGVFGSGAGGTFANVQATVGPAGALLPALAAVRRDMYVEMLRVVMIEQAGRELIRRVEAATERVLAANQAQGKARTDLPAALLAQMVVQSALGAAVRWLADPESQLDRVLVASVMFLHETIKVRPAT